MLQQMFIFYVVLVFKRSINTSINPCDNFYEYACGKWSETHPTVSEFVASSTVQQRKHRNRIELKGLCCS